MQIDLIKHVYILRKLQYNVCMSKINKRPRCPAIYRIVERFKPLSGDEIGAYLQVAAPNTAGRDFRGNPCPSYEKPYKLEPDALVLTEKDVRRQLHRLHQYYILRKTGA